MTSTLGDSLGIVSGVYVAVLIPWTLLYTLDFISSKWVSIMNTERKGWTHLVIITIPISYIFAYIVFQTQLPEPDYKEMYAAVAALVLSGYHLARTVWGLRQLVYLKRWVRETARIFQDAGYDLQQEPGLERREKTYMCSEQHLLCGPYTLFRNVPIVRRILSRSREAVRGSRQNTVDDVVRRIQVNNSLIDNEFNAGIADHVKLVSWSRILLLPLRPSKPMVTFTRWATAFIAQFGTSWLSDATVSEENGDPWIDKRRNFALQVLTTAILQMDPFESHAYFYNKRASRVISKGGKSFLPPDAWEDISRSKDAWHVFSPPKILAAFLAHNEGLPYGWQVVEEGQKVPTRSLLKPILKEAINGLKPKMQEALEVFRSEHLELFAVFLWVQNNSRRAEAKDKSQFRQEENFIASEASYEFLQRQLGLDEDERALENLGYPFSKHARSRHLWYNRNVLEVSCRIDNWLALSSGEQLFSLDDVLGINDIEYDRDTVKSEEASISEQTPSSVSGERRNASQQISMQNFEPELVSHDIHYPIPIGHGDSGDKHTKKETCYKQNKLLEKKRLRFQLANDERRYDHSEQSLTFMGCVMESLRSGLAEQLYAGLIYERKDMKKRTSSWTVPVPTDFLEFNISQELWKCLRKRKEAGSLHSAIQERLLWECQVGTHHLFQGVLSEPNAHHKAPSMILFILGFPSVFIRRKPRDGGFGAFPVLEYTIHAAIPPQQIHVSVKIEKFKGSPLAKLRLLEEDALENGGEFQWKLWRDSFLGRIKAKAKWQKSHGMSQVHVNAKSENDLSKPISNISQGGKKRGIRKETNLMYWEGWPPFREGLAIFEQGFSLVERRRAEAPNQTSTSPDEKKNELRDKEENMRSGRREYGLCSAAILSDSISDIDTALELRGGSVIWGKLKNKEEIKEVETRRRHEGGRGGPSLFLDIFHLRNVFRLTSPNTSPSTRPNVEETITNQDKTADEARNLNPAAMLKVARWVLKGEEGYQQNREQALIIMENALQIDKNVDIARLHVKTCLEGASLYGAKRDENLDRAFSVVQMLWTDVETRLRKGTEEEKSERVKIENERVDQIIDMNGTLVREKRTSATLQDFGDRLTMWFHIKGDDRIRDRAITQYESAVIADGDIFAMLKLALLNATNDEEDRIKMALSLCRSAMEKLKALESPLDGIKGNRFDFAQLSVKPHTLRDVSEYIKFEKDQNHPGAEILAKRMMIDGGSRDKGIAGKSLDAVVPTEDLPGESNVTFEVTQDHTIVNIPSTERLPESEAMPSFPHPSYL